MNAPKYIKFKGAKYRLAEQSAEQTFERLRNLFDTLTEKVERGELTPNKALDILTQEEGFPPEARYPESTSWTEETSDPLTGPV